MRVLNANFNGTEHGVLTNRPGILSNDFFVNLLDMNTTWEATDDSENEFQGRDLTTNKIKWKGTRVDLIFGSNSELRAISEVYGCADGEQKFINDFASGISSGLSYSGAKSFKELQATAEFVQQTGAGTIESRPHILDNGWK